MVPWELIDETKLPDGSAALHLWRRGEEYVIRVDGKDLMSSRVQGSEKALAEMSCAELGSAAHVLVGGLGMGFTLAAALDALGPQATVIVAELVPGVVAWNREVLAPLAGAPLDDRRVEVFEGDVRELLLKPARPYDVILLDVDNGPDGLTRKSNGWLYEKAGLRASYDALKPGGVLGVWSAFEDPEFTRRLERAGFSVRMERVRARGRKGSRHTLWFATR